MSFNYIDHYTMKQNRLKVLKENNYKCAICGGKATEVHHKDNSFSNHNLDNLLPVCHKCHMLLHKQSRSSTKPLLNVKAIEYFLTIKGMTKQELAQELNMSKTAISTMLKRKTTKNSTLKKIAEVLECSINEIIIAPNGLTNLEEKNDDEKKVLIEAINERISELTNDKHLTKLYKTWLTKELREFFGVKSYGLISGKDLITAIKIIHEWKPGVNISEMVKHKDTETA